MLSNSASRIFFGEVESKSTQKGRLDASKTSTRDIYESLDKASMCAALRLPSDDTPLRRQDFFEYDDYLVSFLSEILRREQIACENEIKFWKDRYINLCERFISDNLIPHSIVGGPRAPGD